MSQWKDHLLYDGLSGKEHIDQFMDMLSEFAGHQRHRHSETLQLDIGLLLMDRKGGDRIRLIPSRVETQYALRHGGRHSVVTLARVGIHAVVHSINLLHEAVVHLHPKGPQNGVIKGLVAVVLKNRLSEVLPTEHQGETMALHQTRRTQLCLVFFIERFKEALLVMVEVFATHSTPIESIRIEVIAPTNINNDIALLQDIRIAGSDHH